MSLYPHGYIQGLGPAAPPNTQCAKCGRPAKAQCWGCGQTFCAGPCWSHHGLPEDPHRLGDETWVGIRAEVTR